MLLGHILCGRCALNVALNLESESLVPLMSNLKSISVSFDVRIKFSPCEV